MGIGCIKRLLCLLLLGLIQALRVSLFDQLVVGKIWYISARFLPKRIFEKLNTSYLEPISKACRVLWTWDTRSGMLMELLPELVDVVHVSPLIAGGPRRKYTDDRFSRADGLATGRLA